MGNRRTLEVVIVGDDKKLGNTLSHTEGRLGSFGSKFKTFAGGMITGMAGAFAVDKVVSFGSELFDLGQKLEVMDVKADTVFASAADSVRQWADANNEAFGLSDERLTGLAASLGDLLRPMGFTGDQAAGMSQEMLDLAGALSAWDDQGRSTAEVAEILGKAMIGERDALASLGVPLDQLAIDSELAARGQADLTGEALKQAEAMATMDLVIAGSAGALEAWNNGSMDSVKATNELKAMWADAQVVLAEQLLPAVQGTFGWIRDNVLPIVRGVIDAFEEGGLGGAVTHLADQFNLAWPQIQTALGNLWSNLIGWAEEMRPVLFDTLLTWGEQLVAWIGPQIPLLADELVRIVDQIVLFVEENGTVILERMLAMGEALVSWVAPQIPPLLGELWKLQGRIMVWIGTEAAPMLIAKLVEWAGAFVGWIATDLLPRLPAELMKITDAFGEWIRDDAVPWIQGKAGEFTDPVVQWFRDLPGMVVDAVGDLSSTLWNTGWDIVSGFIEGLIAKAGEIPGVVADWITDPIPQFVKDFFESRSPSRLMMRIGGDVVEGMRIGMVDKAGALIDSLRATFGAATNAVGGMAMGYYLNQFRQMFGHDPGMDNLQETVQRILAGGQVTSWFEDGSAVFAGLGRRQSGETLDQWRAREAAWEASLPGMAADIAAGGPIGAGGAGGGSVYAPVVHLTVNADALADANQVAERVGTAVRRYIDTGGRFPREALGT